MTALMLIAVLALVVAAQGFVLLELRRELGRRLAEPCPGCARSHRELGAELATLRRELTQRMAQSEDRMRARVTNVAGESARELRHVRELLSGELERTGRQLVEAVQRDRLEREQLARAAGPADAADAGAGPAAAAPAAEPVGPESAG